MSVHDETSEARLGRVREKIAQAIENSGRTGEEVNLVAVSKTFDAAAITPVIGAGQMVFGENRVQEAKQKWPELKSRFPNVALHLIGPLQTNKVRDAVALFDCIETVDREKLARALSTEMQSTGRVLPVFIQVNTGAEPQKAGVLPEDTDALVTHCREECELDVVGLMCIPPLDEEPSPHFALLEKIAKRNGLARLSMGMSADFEVAIAFGATDIRVGSAIFGARSTGA